MVLIPNCNLILDLDYKFVVLFWSLGCESTNVLLRGLTPKTLGDFAIEFIF
jgi:hypothetical protein